MAIQLLSSTFEFVDKIAKWPMKMKGVEQYFPVILLTMYKMQVLNIKIVEIILNFDHSNESYCLEQCCSTSFCL